MMFFSSLRQLVNRLSPRPSKWGRSRVQRGKRGRFRPNLEALEDRAVPSTVNWIGGSGNWNDASHWLDADTMTNHVPTAGDDAAINLAAITVTHDTGSHAVHSLAASNGTFELSDGTLTVATTLQGNSAFTLGRGTLANA